MYAYSYIFNLNFFFCCHFILFIVVFFYYFVLFKLQRITLVYAKKWKENENDVDVTEIKLMTHHLKHLLLLFFVCREFLSKMFVIHFFFFAVFFCLIFWIIASNNFSLINWNDLHCYLCFFKTSISTNGIGWFSFNHFNLIN